MLTDHQVGDCNPVPMAPLLNCGSCPATQRKEPVENGITGVIVHSFQVQGIKALDNDTPDIVRNLMNFRMLAQNNN